MTHDALFWESPRTVTTTRILLEIGAGQGLSPKQCLQGSQIDPCMLEDPLATISAQQELQVIRNLHALLGPEFPLGLEIGSRHHFTTFGIWGFALVSSSTFVSAVSVGLRYLQLTTTYSRITATARGHEAILLIDDQGLPEDVRDVLIESAMATLITLQIDLDPVNLPAKALRLKRQAPAYASRFEALFGVMPDFAQSENAVAVDINCLTLALPQANPLTRKYAETECQKLLAQRTQRKGYAGQIRDQLAGHTTHFPAMPVLAKELGTTPRTLRRRLAIEGVTYEDLIDEVRETLAEGLLKATTLSVEEISTRLGYSEPSAFARAFRRWKAMSPREYRHKDQSSETTS